VSVPVLGDRGLFPELEPTAYLNHAGISPVSLDVKYAVRAILDDYGRRGAAAYPAWAEQRARLKQKLGALVGARGEDLAITQNTTRGVTDVALAIPWKRGDRVVLFEGEFPSNVTPWQRAAEAFDLEIAYLPTRDYLASDEPGLARLAAELERPARLVAVSAVEFQTGLRTPIGRMAELAHAAGAELFVDAVQAVGANPIDVTSDAVDYLACGSHKWLMGVEGAGFLYVAPARVEALRPLTAGWLSHEDGLSFLFEGPGHLLRDRPLKRAASVFEGANVSAVGCAALEASVDLLLALGVDAVHAHVNRYLDDLEPALVARGLTSLRRRDAAGRSAILSMLPPEGVDVIALQRALGERGVAAATPDGHLRLAPHWPNGAHEVPLVVDAFDAALHELEAD
jgi:selenocysteine lyase/cysteine desulfurase